MSASLLHHPAYPSSNASSLTQLIQKMLCQHVSCFCIVHTVECSLVNSLVEKRAMHADPEHAHGSESLSDINLDLQECSSPPKPKQGTSSN